MRDYKLTVVKVTITGEILQGEHPDWRDVLDRIDDCLGTDGVPGEIEMTDDLYQVWSSHRRQGWPLDRRWRALQKRSTLSDGDSNAD